MKKFVLAGLLFLLFGSATAFSQFSFGISPGLSLNSAYFGYKIGNLVPFAGVQYFSLSTTVTEKGALRWDYETNQFVSDNHEATASGSVIIPAIGVKFFFTEVDKLKSYLSLSLTKPFFSASAEYDGEEEDDMNEVIDNLSIFGGELGFGVEYFFDQHFAIGGEFGVRYFYLSTDEKHNETEYPPFSGEPVQTEITNEVSVNITPTFTKLTLNYYF